MKILVVDGSNRNGGNSCMAISMLERALAEHEVKSLTLRQSDCRFCLACDACQEREGLFCVQKDDITELLPFLSICDAVVIASPIYDHRISSRVELFFERLYAMTDMRNGQDCLAEKKNNKVALLLSCFSGSQDVYRKYAESLIRDCLWQISAGQYRVRVFGGMMGREFANHPEYIQQLSEIADWLKEGNV